MIRIIVLLIVVLVQWFGIKASPMTYSKSDSILVCQILAEASGSACAFNDVLFVAEKFLGKPYVAHTLEVNDEEKLVINTRELDCTTFIETVTALVICIRYGKCLFSDYTDILRSIRYREGEINGYASRLHYFSDWIVDNHKKGWVYEVNMANLPFTSVQELHVNYMSTHPSAYKALCDNPFLASDIELIEQELSGKSFRFIPEDELLNTRQIRNVINDGDIIAITSAVEGLDIAHVGFAFWKSDGLHLLHASSVHKKVIKDNTLLWDYLRKRKHHTGVRVVRIK